MDQVDASPLMDWNSVKGTVLGTWLKNRLLQLIESGTKLTSGHIDDLLHEALDKGSPELSSQADSLMQHKGVSRRAGSRVQIEPLTWNQDSIGSSKVIWNEEEWTRYDFGDTLATDGKLSQLLTDGPDLDPMETHQCLVIHAAAGWLYHKHKQLPSLDSVHQKAQEFRLSLARSAYECKEVLGPLPDQLT